MSGTDRASSSYTSPSWQVVAGQRETPVNLARLGVSLAVGVAALDVCFWHVDQPGLCVALFFSVLAVLILGNREKRCHKQTTLVLLLLLTGAAVAAAIETCFTNSVIFVVLILALGGETFFTEKVSGWARGVAQVIASSCAPGRFFWLAAQIIEIVSGREAGWAGGIVGGCLLLFPAIVLALIFGSLLASGNAVFGSWINSFFGWLIDYLAVFLDFRRILFWIMGGLLMLPLLRPAEVSSWWEEKIQHPRRVPEIIPARAAVAASALILIVLNLLFLVANSADALFLWSGKTLPTAVAYKTYVHEGIDTLIFTVILTALVLTIIFQQASVVVQRPVLHRLALVWIIQNLFLLTSCALRLKDYIETFGMTTARLSALLFLVLVAAGFFLLTVKIRRDKSLPWLVGGCLLATFCVFYVAQFLDLAGWSANYNVARWEKDRAYPLNGTFYTRDGVPAAAIWPALRRAGDPGVALPRGDIPVLENWREFSLRAWFNRWALEDDPKK